MTQRRHDGPPRVSGETYFFRDHGQFDLLHLRLLPELIERRRARKSLRLWSAGCASGEEAYSLAMLVDMLLPQRDGWDILVLGSDVDTAALAKARRGRYGEWSFRTVPPTLKQRYFRRAGDDWVLDERIRRMVTFHDCDLVGSDFPDAVAHDLDLILCRNVFIYFAAATVAAVADKMAASLADGGYLMAGHTELIGHRLRDLRSRLFAEGIVYQRCAATPVSPAPARVAHRTGVLPPVSVPLPPAPAAGDPAPSADQLLTAARQLADSGDYAQAAQCCRQALALAPLAAAPHFLLAQLAQLVGDFAAAGQLLEKTLYLDPGDVAAHLELAALRERAGDLPRALALRRAALDILRALPGDTLIATYEASAAALLHGLA